VAGTAAAATVNTSGIRSHCSWHCWSATVAGNRGITRPHGRVAFTAVLSVPSHEVGPWEPELTGEPRVSVLGVVLGVGSLGGGGGEPHAELVHHAGAETVLGPERHTHVSTLKE